MLPDTGQLHSSLAGANALIGPLPGVLDTVSAADTAVRPSGAPQGIVLSSEAAAWASSAALFAEMNSALAELKTRVAALPPVE